MAICSKCKCETENTLRYCKSCNAEYHRNYRKKLKQQKEGVINNEL